MAQIIKKGPSYMVRVTWRDHTGKQHKKSKSGFKTKAQARKFAAEIESQKYSGQISAQDPTFYQYFLDWYTAYKKNRVANATKNQYTYVLNVIKTYFGNKRLSTINRRQYQLFLNEFGTNHSKKTVTKLSAYIRACVHNAIIDGIINNDFTERTELVWDAKRTQKIDYLNIAELNQLVIALEANRQPRYTGRYMILTAIYTGMRLAEIAALTWQDINFDFKTVQINKSWNYLNGGGFKPTKNKSSNRIIRVDNHLLSLLAELKENHTELVFGSQIANNVPGSNAVNKTLRKFLKQCCINKPSFHFHSLRHTHVAYLLSQGIPLYAISQRLGHSNMTTTATKYAYLIDEFKARSDDLIEEALSDIGGVPEGVPTSKFI